MLANHITAAESYVMKPIPAIALAAILLSACSVGSHSGSATQMDASADRLAPLTSEEKHRLYTAALMAADFPLDSEIFKAACRRIGIMDANGNPNADYLEFVREHVDWGLKPETEQFRQEINTRAKAEEYANNCLLQR